MRQCPHDLINTRIRKYIYIFFLVNIIVAILLISLVQRQVVSKPTIKVEPKILDPKIEIVKTIAEIFPENPKLMVAIALEESRLNPKATGYNCRYKITTATTTFDKLTGTHIDTENISQKRQAGYVSTWCRKGDQSQAWSKDAGIFAINNPKPEHYIPEVNISEARNKYDTQGLSAWTAYTSGRYKRNLIEAEKLLAQI